MTAFGDNPKNKEKQEQAKQRVKDKIANFRNCFGTESGEKVLADLRRFCRMDSTTHVKGDTNGRESAFLEGQRNVFLYIEACMNENQENKLMQLEQGE
ncbi:MAG: hypothetical protein KGY38_07435 [Desulfobacterales bacterium]|nr:hypothetical protein [Desulfobacterales bacterium]